MRKTVFGKGFPTRSDKKLAEQPQKMARGFRMYLLYTAKTNVQISCVVTAQLNCAFVFAYAKSRFSHDAAHLRAVS